MHLPDVFFILIQIQNTVNEASFPLKSDAAGLSPGNTAAAHIVFPFTSFTAAKQYDV